MGRSKTITIVIVLLTIVVGVAFCLGFVAGYFCKYSSTNGHSRLVRDDSETAKRLKQLISADSIRQFHR